MTNDKDQIQAQQIFGDFLKRRHLRQTYERYAILGIVMAVPGHFTVEQFEQRVTALGNHFSTATIYSTFQLLCQAGLMRRHTFDGHGAEFERILPGSTASNHVHLICKSCGTVREVKNSDLTAVVEQHRFPRFSPEYSQIYVYGLCLKCRRRAISDK